MRSHIFLTVLLMLAASWCRAQVCGCTDSLAVNYNADATVNDGSCLYDSTVITPVEIAELDSLLFDTSALLYWENNYWTYNDWFDSCLYMIDSTNGAILNTICLEEVVNRNSEELAQDSLYIYIGVTGNNHGDRHDLHILRIKKESILNQPFEVDTIWYSYEDQTDFSYQTENNDFDCEAFLVTDDSIYLFTKQWVSEQTTVYGLPKTPGTYIAHRHETYDVKGLVTGCTYLPQYRLLVLCGYDYNGGHFWDALHPFILLLYDFQGDNFFSGNKRRLDFEMLAKAQIEAIATSNALDYYITNEHFTKVVGFVAFDISAKLQRLDLREYLIPYLSQYMDSFPPPPDTVPAPDAVPDVQSVKDHFRVYPNPATDQLHIDFPQEFLGANYEIRNLAGRKVAGGTLRDNTIPLSNKNMAAGEYLLVIRKRGQQHSFKFVRKER